MGHRSPSGRNSRRHRIFREFGVATACGGLCRRARLEAGFTLIELMVTVAIIGILAGVAYPSYVQYVVRSNRVAVESFLLEVASIQERFLVDNRAYATSLSALGYASLPATISPNYQVTVTALAGPPLGYVLTAAPQGTQATNDTACGTLTLSNTGDKGVSGTGSNCWK